jgi:hypothetical protein
MWATMDVPSEGIHTWHMSQVTKIMPYSLVTVVNIHIKHGNIITLYGEITMILFDDDAFTHHMMCRSLVVTTWYTWKMCRRIFNILSFSETVFYLSKT